MEKVIRCKDCKFYKWRCAGICENMDAPWNHESGSLIFVEEDDFCSYAEPKEETM